MRKKGPKTFWFKRSNKTANKNYLLALVLRQRLQEHGVMEIPHLKSASFYGALLSKAGVRRGYVKHKKVKLAFVGDDGCSELQVAAPRASGTSASSNVGPREAQPGHTSGPTADDQPADAGPSRGRKRNERTYQWGPRVMTFKPPMSWQATCCFKVKHGAPDRPST
eukprot:4370017-Lingulodinium_polyedra.AAC.1